MHNSEVSQTPVLAGEYPTESQEDNRREQKTAADIQTWLVAYVAELLEIEPAQVDVTIPLERYGLDSSAAVVLSGDLQDWLGCDLEPELLLDYPTIEALTQYLIEEGILTTSVSSQRQNKPGILPHKGDVSGVHPLSCGQRALWFLYKLMPQSAAYNVAFTARIRSPINVSALQKTFQELSDRHPMLRATFFEQDGEPLQAIRDRQEVCFEEIDASAWSAAELKQRVIETYQRPFDLERELLRVSLFNRSECDHVLLLTLHHIICDGWSIWLLLDELRVLYQAQVDAVDALLPQLEFSYLDYVRWQSEVLASSEGERLWNYWQQQLAGELPVLNLPTDRPRPSVQTNRGASRGFALSRELSQKLKELAHSEGTTLFMTLLAAFQILLYRYTAQEDILVGSPMKCRNQPEWTRVFGYLVNPVVLRANLSGNPTFQAFLAQVRQTVLGAITHQDYPFPLLVERLQPERNSSLSPLFQAMFVLQKPQKSEDIVEILATGEPEARINWGGLKLESFDIPQQEGQFDLSLEMIEGKDSLFGVFKYDSDLFEEATISRVIDHFQTLLAGITINPRQTVAQLPILTAAERQQLLVEWNNTQAPYPQDKCIHQLFEEQVEKTPEAVAAVFEDQQLTYRELNRRANQLAHYLQTLGVGPEVLVGICARRSLEMVIGVLGIFKAGGAYVPLDPAYPHERIAYMLNDSQVSILVTQRELVARLPGNQGQLVCLDTDWEEISDRSANNPTDMSTDNLAYVIYTSGSTGKPKGVLVTHQGLGNLVQAQIRLFDVGPDSRVLQFASLSFDASIWEIVMALGTGASLHLAKPDALLPGTNLRQLLQRRAITHVTLPPSALAAMQPETLPALEAIIVAGEACSPELAAKWSVGQRFFNAYGPTEATVCATVAECIGSSERPPIGRPIANAQVYLLDAHLQPVPLGVPGEIHIGGIGLARGYLNRRELTQEKFIPNPFSQEEETRLYKTGDLARYLSNGNIEFLGRIDHQVKIRGFRIELGEVEALLANHPQVRETVIVAREEQLGKRLVAYIVPNQKPLAIGELRGFLKQHLPDYMMPSAFMLLDEMPLTPNGKIDRRALPAPKLDRGSLETDFVAPRTPQEEVLAAIWAEVLGLEQLSIYDNFFELGGDSILSLQVIARSNQVGLSLTPQQIFQHQTIAELATVAGTTAGVKAEQGLVIGAVPLTPIQHWFFEQNPPEPYHFNQSVLLEVSDIKPEPLRQAIEQLRVHHDALRLRFASTGNGWEQKIERVEENVPFEVVDLSNLSAQEQTSAIEARASELQASLNLSEGPIMQAALFKFGSHQPGRLLIIIHHLAVDGVSWRILLEDLATAYNQLIEEEAVKLPLKTTSWKYWAEQLLEYGQSEERLEELNYWLAQSDTKLASLPLDYPDNQGKDAYSVADADTVTVALSEEQTWALLHSVPAAYNTQINDVLLTALVQTFALWTGERSLLVDLEGHGREDFEQVDLSRTVGWFTSLFPVLLKLKASDHPGEALKSVKEQLRRVPKRGIGYGILRYLSQEEHARNLRTLPPAPVSFNYLGQFESRLTASPILGWATESRGQEQSLHRKRRHLLEVNSLVTSRKLRIDWTYSRKVHQRATVEQLAQGFMEALAALIDHCQSPGAGGYTPSDFPLAQLDEEKFKQLSILINKADRSQEPFKAKITNVEDIYPLSPPQQDMLFHNLRNPDTRSDFQQLRLTLHGNLNVLAFEQAWQQVVARHPVLRTCFFWEGLEQPLQVVRQQANLPGELYDWRELTATEQEKRLSAFLESQRKPGFNFEQAPLMRFVLVHLATDTYEFLLSFHHILLDGWSFWKSIVQEALALYEAINNSKNLHLDKPPFYRDYIGWLQQQDSSRIKAFWRQELKGFTAPTALLSSAVSNQQKDRKEDEQTICLSESATATLQSLAREQHITMSTLVHGAWALLLSHYSGDEDVVFGTTVSGRIPAIKGVESIVGLLCNILPVRMHVSREACLLSWLKQLQKHLTHVSQHAPSSLLEIQSWSDVPDEMPLFDTHVVFENYPLNVAQIQQMGSLQIGNVQYTGGTNFITLIAMPGRELSVQFVYKTSCFSQETIERLLEHYQILLAEIADNPWQLVSEVLFAISG